MMMKANLTWRSQNIRLLSLCRVGPIRPDRPRSVGFLLSVQVNQPKGHERWERILCSVISVELWEKEPAGSGSELKGRKAMKLVYKVWFGAAVIVGFLVVSS